MHLSIKSTLMDKRSRMQKQKVATMQLQLLPYDVLCNILSRLSIKDVVRMSMLSNEWRQQRICHPDLVFTKDTFGISIDPDLDFTKDVSGINADLNTNRASRTAEFIANNVDSVLRPLWSSSTATTTTLDKFAVEYGLRRKHQYHIDRWVSFFTASKAKHIAFNFTSDINCSGSRFNKYMYVFPLRNLSGPNASFVNYLDLGYVWLKLPPSFCGITNLKKLTLNMVSISGVDLQCLLLSCALLESINIERCSSFSSLRIRQELCQLQYMRVRHCKLEIIELHAPNLKKIEFDDSLMQIVLGECSKLSDATFLSNRRASDFDDYGFDFNFTKLPTALPHVQKLVILLNVDQVLRFSENQITSFINLRHMNMNLQIGWALYDDSWAIGFVHLLQLSPLLEELELHLGRDRCFPPAMRTATATATQGPLHHHLKSVHISGFCNVLGLAELALYILGNATALNHMVVDPVPYGYSRHTDDIYSVSKASTIEGYGDQYVVRENRMFAERNLGREEFHHILTIL